MAPPLKDDYAKSIQMGITMHPEDLARLNAYVKTTQSQNRSEVIRKAIDYYLDFHMNAGEFNG